MIFNRSITNYRLYPRGSDTYLKQYEKRMNLKGKINNALLRDYSNKKQTVNHFFDSDRSIPIWAIFDTRFQTSRINQCLISLLEVETGISNLDFKYIDAYVVLITYTLRKMGETKTSCKQFISSFITCTDALRSHLKALQNFLSKS